MTYAPECIVRRLGGVVGLLALTLFSVPRAGALEPPTAGEWQRLAANSEELEVRVERAKRFGNHKVKPWLAQATARRLDALARGEEPSPLPPSAWQGMPTKGTNNVLVFLIDFPGTPHINPYEMITNKLFGAGVPAEFPLESLTKFYERSSYGMLTIQGMALGWYRMQHERDWYTSTYGTGNAGNYAIIKEVAEHFDASIDYRQFDNNKDGKIDYFAVLWAGADNGWANFWWGYQWELQQNLTLDTVRFLTFSWQWESRPVGSVYEAETIIHETGHALGLPDYYDYDGSVGPDGGVGGMDMMHANYCDHNCFSKFMLEWLTPTVVSNAVDNFPLQTAANYPEAVALAKGYSGSTAFAEYFMVQNRQKVNNDKNLPGAGLVTWHIDARLDGTGTDFLYDNSYAAHKLLRLMEADGLEEIEANGNADAGDFYVTGKEFTPESMPNSLSYAGLSTEVRVTDISASAATMTADFSARDNSPVLSPSPIYVREGSTTNVSVSLWRPPTTNTTITVRWLSGSPALYVEGVTNFTFTPLDYATPQTLVIGSYNDGDESNDVAIFRMVSSGASVQGLDFAVEQMDTGDSLPPACAITGSANAERTEVTFDFLFNEAVMGFEAADIVATDNIAGGAVLQGLSDVSGNGRRYQAVFVCADTKGSITLRVPAGSLTDLSGNANPNPEYRAVFTIPWVKSDFADTFDGEVSLWTPSTNVFEEITTDGWRWGEPFFVEDWPGPLFAHSGTKCWGTLAGPYDRYLDACVRSPPIPVGDCPALSFWLWLEPVGAQGGGSVEVNDGGYWRTVGSYGSTGGAWVEQRIALDTAVFGNRTIQVRFRSIDAAMYIDDVRVDSQRGPAVWLVAVLPTNGPAGATVPVAFQVYNSTTSALADVTGEVTCADAGVTIVGGTIAYGTLAAGAMAFGGTDVNVSLPTVMSFEPVVQLRHQSKVGTVVSAEDTVAFGVSGAVIVSATNVLTASASVGVTDWLGRPLAGNGSEGSCLFQVLYAGTNSVIDPPTSAGQATGDDRILYSSDAHRPWGWFGAGGVIPNLGRFTQPFAHALPSNAIVYVRAWDAASFDGAVAYGDSAPQALTAQSVQSRDFGSWRVDKPSNYSRDSNGDSIPDGWCVLHGQDPRLPVAALPLQVGEARAIGDVSTPARVAVSSNFVFVADTGNNRVQVWNRALTSRLSVFGSSTEFGSPLGIAVSRDGARVAVADTLKNRVRVFSVTSPAGTLTPLFAFGSFGSGDGQFNSPVAVTFGPGGGDLYVADSRATGTGNNRVQVFALSATNGVFVQTFGSAGTGDGQFGRLLGVGVGTNGTLYAADGPNNRVQLFADGATFEAAYGTGGSSVGEFNWVWDAQPGVGGLLYVTDFNNKRIQILNVRNPAAISAVGAITNAGTLGAFNLPRGAAPAPDDGLLYVADTYNNRVLRLRVTLDSDGDGLDDVWESLHGLDPSNPADAGLDADGDGVSNVGEYRIGADPNVKDTNGNGASDGWELAVGLDPTATGGVSIAPPTGALSASPASPVRPGQTVRVTATFSEAIATVPSVTLGGAASVDATPMAGSGSAWYYDYAVPGAVSGAVNVTVSGAIGTNGYPTDPVVLTSNALFTVAGGEFRISGVSVVPNYLTWNTWSGDIFRVQTSTNLMFTNWVNGVTVTSRLTGALSVSNAFSSTNRMRYMRVLWLNAP